MTKKLGYLWEKKSGKGLSFFSGNLDIDGKKIPVVVFPNRDKEGKQPDWNIYLSEPKGVSKPKDEEVPF
jgi:hypothetical protein